MSSAGELLMGAVVAWFFLLVQGAAQGRKHELCQAIPYVAEKQAQDESFVNDRMKTETASKTSAKQPNLLFIMTDQQRFDTLRFIQDSMPGYDGKFKIRTPNIDRLAASGAWFRTAYCQSPQCVPSRATVRTGCTVERTGLQEGSLINEEVYSLIPHFKEKIEKLVTYDQVLVEERNYTAENYGRWHLPEILRYTHKGARKRRIIEYNDYTFNLSEPIFWNLRFQDRYRVHVAKQANPDSQPIRYEPRQQWNKFSEFPYTPLPLDPRFTTSKNYNISRLPEFQQKPGSTYGRDSLSANYSSTALVGETAVKALERLLAGSSPFVLTISFWSPHPPNVAPPEYFDYYFEKRSQLYVSPSLKDSMKHNAYAHANQRDLLIKRGYTRPQRIQEWTATHYAMIEEIDTWVGKLLSALDNANARNNTMVIFTGDHGEMLGAHGMRNKGILLEEAVRVPLIISLPGKIKSGTAVDDAVSHIDIFSTILDYLGASEFDESDGSSLRRHLEKSSYNDRFDERAVVGEIDLRFGVDKAAGKKKGKQGQSSEKGDGLAIMYPNFFIRHERYKLFMPRNRHSRTIDMMFDISRDPLERHNLLRVKPNSRTVIGKAEHLKVLLVEWLHRRNGKERFYSDNRYNSGSGDGDIAELWARRTWPRLDYWQSDRHVVFGQPVEIADGYWMMKEYLYIGRTTPGTLTLNRIAVRGPHSQFFSVSRRSASVPQSYYVRIQITFTSPTQWLPDQLKPHIVIAESGTGHERRIELRGLNKHEE